MFEDHGECLARRGRIDEGIHRVVDDAPLFVTVESERDRRTDVFGAPRQARPVKAHEQRFETRPARLHRRDIVHVGEHGADPATVLVARRGNVALPAMGHHEDIGDVFVPHGTKHLLAEEPAIFLALVAMLVEADEVVAGIVCRYLFDGHRRVLRGSRSDMQTNGGVAEQDEAPGVALRRPVGGKVVVRHMCVEPDIVQPGRQHAGLLGEALAKGVHRAA